jgi:hypothetical protein
MSHHTPGGGGTGQCHQITQGGGGGLKSSKKVSRIISMAPYANLSKLFEIIILKGTSSH